MNIFNYFPQSEKLFDDVLAHLWAVEDFSTSDSAGLTLAQRQAALLDVYQRVSVASGQMLSNKHLEMSVEEAAAAAAKGETRCVALTCEVYIFIFRFWMFLAKHVLCACSQWRRLSLVAVFTAACILTLIHTVPFPPSPYFRYLYTYPTQRPLIHHLGPRDGCSHTGCRRGQVARGGDQCGVSARVDVYGCGGGWKESAGGSQGACVCKEMRACMQIFFACLSVSVESLDLHYKTPRI